MGCRDRARAGDGLVLCRGGAVSQAEPNLDPDRSGPEPRAGRVAAAVAPRGAPAWNRGARWQGADLSADAAASRRPLGRAVRLAVDRAFADAGDFRPWQMVREWRDRASHAVLLLAAARKTHKHKPKNTAGPE